MSKKKTDKGIIQCGDNITLTGYTIVLEPVLRAANYNASDTMFLFLFSKQAIKYF